MVLYDHLGLNESKNKIFHFSLFASRFMLMETISDLGSC
jgi:hypothetical protein